jgi:outer membrane lipoprotein-sorting protein
MRRTACPVALLALTLTAFGHAAARATTQTQTADHLVDRVLDARITSGFRIRTTVTHTKSGSPVADVRQLLIEGRRDRQTSSLAYRVLWPEALASALVIEDSGDHRQRGFLYKSGAVTTLTPSMLFERFADSDLRVEDLAEAFWYWRSRKTVGEETIDDHRTVLVECRPDRNAATAYSWIKAWISPELALPMRLEQFDRGGHFVKRIAAYRVVQQGERWLPTLVTVEPADRRSRTVIEGAKAEYDLHLPPDSFTVDGVRKAMGARP